jgi:hypothetical protein
MGTSIITKFRVASDETVGQLMYLISTRASERFAGILSPAPLAEYIAQRYSPKDLINHINNFANQWLITYVDGEPAGYAFLASRGIAPAIYQQHKTVHLVDFEILDAYADPAVSASLLEKCITTFKGYELMWMVEQTEQSILPFLTANGFVKGEEVAMYNGLSIPAVYMTKEMK